MGETGRAGGVEIRKAKHEVRNESQRRQRVNPNEDRLFRVPQDRSEDSLDLGGLAHEPVAFHVGSRVARGIEQPEEVSALLRLPGDFDLQEKVFLAQRVIGLDVIRTNRSGGAAQLANTSKFVSVRGSIFTNARTRLAN